MKTRDMNKLSLREAMDVQCRICAVVKKKREQVVRARERVIKLARKLGVSVKELTKLASRRGPDKAPRKVRKATTKRRMPAAVLTRKANGSAEHATRH